MAVLLAPQGSAEARGRLGGIVHNTWRGISYAKAKTSPAQPRSKRQLQIRAWTTMLVRYWGSTLSDTNREYWNDYATSHLDLSWTGNPKRLSGLNWFVRCNLRIMDLGVPILTAPPVQAAPDAPTHFAAADGALQSVVTWDAFGGTDITVDIYLVGPHSKGLQAKIERASHFAFPGGEEGTITLTPLRVGRYTVFARAIRELEGLTSPWVSDICDITPS